MRFVATTVKKRPFKIWPRNKRFEVKLSNSQQYFPANLPSMTFLAHNSFYMPNLRFRRVVVKATAYGYLSSNSIEAFRKVIAPNFRKKRSKIYKFLIRCYSFLPLTKKLRKFVWEVVRVQKFEAFFAQFDPVKFCLKFFVGTLKVRKILCFTLLKKFLFRLKWFFIYYYEFY